MSREEYKEETNKTMNKTKSEKQKKEVFRNRPLPFNVFKARCRHDP